VKVLTANRLSDGVVVYRAADGAWTRVFEEAERLSPEAATEALAEATAQPGLLVAPYLVEVDGNEVEKRERLREGIRAQGPTVGHSLEWSA
jgi:Protein of unknown function (DUF2849)